MPDNEIIGGISVQIGVTEDGIDAALGAIEKKLDAWVAKVSPKVNVAVGGGPSSGRGAAGNASSGGASSTQLTSLTTSVNKLSTAITSLIAKIEASNRVASSGGRGGGRGGSRAASVLQFLSETGPMEGPPPMSPPRPTPGMGPTAANQPPTRGYGAPPHAPMPLEAQAYAGIDPWWEKFQTGLVQRQRQANVEDERTFRQSTQRLQVQLSQFQTGGRTPRTMASALGGMLFGSREQQLQAAIDLQKAQSATRTAQRLVDYQENEIEKQAVIEESSRNAAIRAKRANAPTEEINAFRERERTARTRRQQIEQSAEYADAQRGVTRSIENEISAEKQLSAVATRGTGLRTLLSVTVGGAAFGAGLAAFDLALKMSEKALAEYTDIQTGFGATSTRVTTQLGQQTLALKGNAAEALAAAEAQAGLSTSASDFVSKQLLVTTQIKAGAQALTQASDLFRAAYGVGSAPSGLYGGYGGLGGTALFAQEMGGGMGFTEQVSKNMAAFSGGGGPDLLGNLNAGLSYATNPQVRDFINSQSQQQGDILGNIIGTISRIPGGIADRLNPNALTDMVNKRAQASNGTSLAGNAYMQGLNDAGKRAAAAYGGPVGGYKQGNPEEVAQAIRAAAAAGDTYSASLAATTGWVQTLDGKVVTLGSDSRAAAQQIAIGQGIQDPAQMAAAALAAERQRETEAKATVSAMLQQIAYAAPSFRNALVRTANAQLGTQLPAQAALANLRSPLIAPGIGVAAANAAEQAKIDAGTQQAVAAQRTLNAYYAQGRDAIRQQYDPTVIANFGQQGLQTFHNLLSAIEANGAAIAANETAITKETAALATAQYTEQLRVANLSLTDIRQITGQIGKTSGDNLGIYERENIALGRQSQMLQFQMSQRQINFQLATAGFTVAGLTPAEQAARLAEAKAEAGYAQKQLDIQKQMFGNQVQIVDIGNLRQAVTLANQVNLLLQGRAVTIDVALRQDAIANLQKVQDVLTSQVQVYMGTVDSSVAKGIADIQSLEAAAGGSISNIEQAAAMSAYRVGRSFFLGVSGGFMSQDLLPQPGNTKSNGGGSLGGKATGFIGNVSGASSMTVGEAGTETVAVLRNPRSGGGGMGGGNVYFDFSGTTVRSDADIEAIYRKVMIAMGRDASLRGLRTGF